MINPFTEDGVTKFKVKGNDKEGNFEVRRRYNDFFCLRQNLIQRWPGCYIPPIPPKKTIVSKI